MVHRKHVNSAVMPDQITFSSKRKTKKKTEDRLKTRFAILYTCRPDYLIVSDERVFDTRKEALGFMKGIPGSRFKVFTSRDAAVEYSKGPADCATPKATKQVEYLRACSTSFPRNAVLLL